MQPVKLYTSGGGFVTSGQIPPFVPGAEADVLIWGTRVFTLDYDHVGMPRRVLGALRYTERFAVALVDVEEAADGRA